MVWIPLFHSSITGMPSAGGEGRNPAQPGGEKPVQPPTICLFQVLRELQDAHPH